MPPEDLVIVCDDVSRSFVVSGERVDALIDVDLTAVAGSFTAVTGPSGSGKSTLIALIGCLERPTSGSVTVLGQRVDHLARSRRRELRRSTVATVLPEPTDNLLTGETGRANVEFFSHARSDRRMSLSDVCDRLELGSFIDQPVAAMSGGQQMRIALAAAVAGGYAVLLTDEPTSALDATSAQHVVAALQTLADLGTTIVAATHDPAVTAAATNVVRLEHGSVVS